MMNLQPKAESPMIPLPRPGGPNLLLGLTMRRLLWALVINAVIAVLGAQVRVWPSVEQAMVSAQIVGLSIMLSWTIASNLRLFWLPPLGAQLLFIVVGSALGTVTVVVIKSYIYGYEFGSIIKDPFGAIALLTLGVIFGGFVILTVIARERETRVQAAMHQAEAERHLHGKQLLEARLQLMQAQIEPHFLFNTLATVQHLVETDPGDASRMLGDLIKYLRAAMPQLRERGTTLAREAELARAYLAIQRIRTGNRFDFSIDIPQALGPEPFPPMMLLTLVENAVKHGFESHAQRGEINVSAHDSPSGLVISVDDTGAGFRAGTAIASPEGVGLTNVRERLEALYGAGASLVLEENSPRGMRASIQVPHAASAAGITPAANPGASAPAATRLPAAVSGPDSGANSDPNYGTK